MRRLIILSAFIASYLAAIAQQQDFVLESKTFHSSEIKKLISSSPGGYIHVEGTTDGTAVVEVILNPNGNLLRKNKGDLKELFEKEYNLDLSVKNTVLTAHAEQKKRFSNSNNSLSVSFRIKVPNSTDTELKTAGGSIKLANLEGNQLFQTSGGSLQLSNLSGQINGKTAGGSIKINDGKGHIILSTSGGSIQLQNISGQAEVKTSGGSIKAKQIQGVLIAKTSGGSINLEDCEGALEAHTSGGSINASMKKLTDDLKLSTSAGSINLKLPDAGYNLYLKGSRVNVSNKDRITGNITKKSIKGTFKEGGYAISASTTAGSVNVSFH